jgi:hypothetical protein
VPGFQSGVGCLTAALCVLTGYDNHSVGDVVPVRNGVPGPGSTVAGSKSLYSVSCPGASGCVAIGELSNDTEPMLVTLNANGGISSSKVVKIAAGVTLSHIACVSLDNCVLTGDDVFASPEALEVAHWDGTSLQLHQVPAPSGTTSPTLEGVSCSGGSCIAVGDAFKGAEVFGLVLDITGSGAAVHLRTVTADSIYGVWCTSPTTCYAAGFTRTGGVLLTIKSGVAGSQQAVSGDLMGIACHSVTCVAVGERLAPPGAPAKAAYYGELVSVSFGKVTGTQLVPQSGGFSNVGRAGSAFAALGAGQGIGSEVTTGALG